MVRLWPDRRLRPRTVVYAVVNSRMDYCNTVLAGAPRTVTDKLQRVLNAAAPVITGTHSDRASYRDDCWLVQTDARLVAPTTASCKHPIRKLQVDRSLIAFKYDKCEIVMWSQLRHGLSSRKAGSVTCRRNGLVHNIAETTRLSQFSALLRSSSLFVLQTWCSGPLADRYDS